MTDKHDMQNGETPDAVHAWICQIRGTKSQTTIYCDRDRARQWIRSRLGADGEWRRMQWRDVYECDDSPDTGIVEFSVIQDAAALLVEE